jgi:DNA sulfur modification protein DndD
MKISKITLQNFRIYKGETEISFTPFSTKNINIIAGKNGFGKTTLLTSLIWVFYGKLMGQVEEKYRKDIKNSGGYSFYLESLINRDLKSKHEGNKNEDDEFSVEIELKDLMIPAIPCESIIIKRSYNLLSKEENLSILIDGIENELTKDVGYDLFINDFILPREIAKFFFFDAEKIVSLAEAKSKDELRSLSKAYSEVLGIKKYEELKKNLESLLTKLLRKGVSESQKTKLDELIQKEKESLELLKYNKEQQDEIKIDISSNQLKSNQLQEKLIREGNSITLEELFELKTERDKLKKESISIKSDLSKLLDLAPLVIAGKKLTELKEQLDKENTNATMSSELLENEIKQFSNEILVKLTEANIAEEKIIKEILNSSIKQKFENQKENSRVEVLVDFSPEQYRNFNAIYTNIKSVYVSQLNSIVQEEKNNRVLSSRVINKIKQAEARKNNHLAKKIRDQKISIDNKVSELTQKLNELLIEQGNLDAKNNSDKRVLSEYEKNFNLLKTDKKKYETTEKLLDKITTLISRIKEDKKYTLQKAIKLSLNRLMHKENFISDVKVNIDEDIMDIELIDINGNFINKDTLSKGEQQLYATALLKALVDESGIKFPIFIDSPLQKFDKYHSKNIIEEFYPTISDQVVLLPLLEKELTEKEYNLLLPNLDKTFVIENKESNASNIVICNIKEVFKQLKTEIYV